MNSPSHLDMSLSWEDIDIHAQSLAMKLANGGPWKGVVAVTSGGMIPACIVARHLGIRHIETFCISSYDDQSQREATIIKHAANAGDGEGWLVIDDLADKGTTLRILRQFLPKAHYATIYVKPTGEPVVDTYIMSVSQDTWLHFPWEKNERSYIAPASCPKP